MVAATNASGRLSPAGASLLLPPSKSAGGRGSIWGPRLPPPALEPSLTSQQWRLQSTNAVYWARGRSQPPASGTSRHIMDANPSFPAAVQPFAISESFPGGGRIRSRRRRWGASYRCDTGVGKVEAAASCRVADCDVFSGSCRESSAVCAAGCEWH